MQKFFKSRSMDEIYKECQKLGISHSAISQYVSKLTTIFGSNRLPVSMREYMLDNVLEYVHEFVLLASLFESTRKSVDTTQLCASLYLYIGPKCSATNFSHIKTFCEKYYIMDNQSGVTLVDLLKTAHTNWKLITESKSLKKISSLLGICAISTFAGRKELHMNSSAIRRYTDSLFVTHMTSIDWVSAIFDTVIHFVEKGYALLTTGDWRSFFVDNSEFNQFDTDFFEISRLSELAECGYLEDEGLTDDDYAEKLDKLLVRAKEYHSKVPNSFEKKIYYERVLALQRMISAFESKRSHGGLREAPLGIALTGPSSVGKSTVTNYLMASILSVHKLGGMEKVITLNEQDKFDSNMKSNIVGVILDDVSNTKPDFVQKAPTDRIISYVNNIVMTAVMPEADMKGKVQIRPKVVIATSNVTDLGARTYSMEPVSVVRRFNIIVRVYVKEQYRMAGSDMLDVTKIPSDDIPILDLWDFDVEYCVGVRDQTPGSIRPDKPDYRLHEFEGRPLKSVDIHTLIAFCVSYFGEHTGRQRHLVKTSNNLYTTIDNVLCKQCYRATCTCMDKQAGFQDVVDRLQDMSNYGVDKLHTIYGHMRLLRKIYNIYKLGPQACYNVKYVLFVDCFLFLLMWFADLNFYIAMYGVTYLLWCNIDLVCSEYENLLRCASANRYLSSELVTNFYRYWQNMLISSFSLYVVYKACIACREVKYSPQGNLSPMNEQDIRERDTEGNVWAKPRVDSVLVSPQSQTITEEQFYSLIASNMYFVNTSGASNFTVCFVKSNFALVPAHMLFDEGVKSEYIVKMYRNANFDENATVYNARISRAMSVQIHGKDLALCYIPNVPPAKDITKYFGIEKIEALDTRFLRKDSNAEIDITPCMTKNIALDGYYYDLEFNTYSGLCGNLLISCGKRKVIMGVHTKGRTNYKNGFATCLLQNEIRVALDILNSYPGIVVSSSESSIKEELYDKQVIVSKDIHPKSPVNFMPLHSAVSIYGQCNGRSTARSRVCTSIISDSVTEHTSVPNKYGPPHFRGADDRQPWKPWQASLEYISKPTIGVAGHLLSVAVVDYIAPLKPLIRKAIWQNDIRPLSDVENVSGIDGKKFVNAMNSQSSVGFPLNGPKSQYMMELDSEEYPEHACPRMLDEKFMEEFRIMEANAAMEERSYPVFKACLKDEPTLKDKDKVRVFQAASIAHQLVLRKYFLPVARFLSMNPLLSECAVGVNSISPEWEQLNNHIVKYGKNNILAGDYSKYDLTMSPQLVIAAFDIMIELASNCTGYTLEDITVMKNLVSDVAYPLVAYNGDLLQFVGTNPSGQTLTVYVNSIVNALLFRCGFYHIIGDFNVPFRDACALMTYGDDAKSSVRTRFRRFNHIAFANYLGENGMKFTMPDKTSKPTRFMSSEQADFLKRKTYYHRDLRVHIGVLDEESIFKSLHCHLRSPHLSLREQAAVNIDGAILEWFYHGRSIFEMRQRQMQRIAKDCDVSHMCCNLDKPYEDFISDWFEKYAKEIVMNDLSDD